MSSFKFLVITPSGVALEESADEVYLKTSSGEIGFLPNHCDYAGLVSAGSLKYRVGNTQKIMTISEGSATFKNGCLELLVETVS
jgi:F0F1-type ATP synthase epsilon subunit